LDPKDENQPPPLLLLLSDVLVLLDVSVEKVVPMPSLEVKDSEAVSSVVLALLPPPK
jgi:hypothetical protein